MRGSGRWHDKVRLGQRSMRPLIAEATSRWLRARLFMEFYPADVGGGARAARCLVAEWTLTRLPDGLRLFGCVDAP
jgi:hypothetical protein